MQQELDSAICEHQSEELWQEVCNFFQHDPSDKRADYVVRVKGFARRLLPVQAYTAIWVLKRCYGIHGSAIVGLLMGLGKTTVTLVVHLLRHVINLAHADIERYPQNHYPASPKCLATRMSTELGIDCPCHPQSGSHWTRKLRGFTLNLIPRGVLKVWEDEAAACFTPVDNVFHIEVWKAHGNSSLTDAQVKALKGGYSNKQSNVDDAGRLCIPRLGVKTTHSRYMILTTSHSVQSRVVNAFMHKRQINRSPDARGRARVPLESPLFFNAVIGMIVRDEFHLERNETSATIQALKNIRSRASAVKSHQPSLMILSGTPITTGPSDISYYLRAMQRQRWAQHPVLRRYMNEEIIDLGKAWDVACRKGAMTEEKSQGIIAQFRPVVEELMIRFTHKTNFLASGAVVKLPECRFAVRMCAHDPEWTTRLSQQKQVEDEAMAKREAKRRATYYHKHRGNMTNYLPLAQQQANTYYRSRLYASFPALLDIKDHSGQHLALTEAEWLENTRSGHWEAGTATDPYYHNREKIFASSGKLTEVQKIWTRFSSVIDAERRPARLILCSYFFAGAYLLNLVGFVLLSEVPLPS